MIQNKLIFTQGRGVKNRIMTKLITVFFVFSMMPFGVQAQSKADEICGLYYAADPGNGEGSQIRIYKNANGKYEGKVVWMQYPNHPNGEPRRDVKNPDASKRTQTNVGLVLIKDFVYNEKEDQWEGGMIYNPAGGNYYRSYMRLESNGEKLKVRGYLGVSLLGKTVIWTRETEQKK